MTTLDNIPKVLDQKLDRLVNKSIDYTLNIVQKRLIRIQQKFFTTLVSPKIGIIGSSSPSFSLPTEQGQSLMQPPIWPSFSKDHARRKQRRYRNRFFIDKGELKNTLRGLNAISIFGEPTLTYKQPGKSGGSKVYSSKTGGGFKSTIYNKSGGLVKNGRFAASGHLGTISIDFFPKLQTGFKQSYGPRFYKEFFGQKQTSNKSGKPVFVGMKLNNKTTPRNFIGHYMEWWMKTKAKRAISKGSI